MTTEAIVTKLAYLLAKPGMNVARLRLLMSTKYVNVNPIPRTGMYIPPCALTLRLVTLCIALCHAASGGSCRMTQLSESLIDHLLLS